MLESNSSVLRQIALAVLLLFFARPTSAIVTVGPGCTFTSLQQAIDTVLTKERNGGPADVFIGVVGGVSYNEVLNIDSSNITSYSVQFLNTTFDHAFIQIFGDYAGDCTNEDGSTAQIDATGKAGSAFFIHGGNNIEVILKNLLITGANNQEGTAQGGGIDFNGTGKLDLTNIDISGNRAGNFNVFTQLDFGEGGGIFAFGASPGLQIVLHNTTIENNTADIDGGGIVISGETQLFADDGTPIIISGNSTSLAGGGLLIRDQSALELSSTGIGNNQAQNGAGIYADGPVSLLFDDSVDLVFNTASDSGGGILLQNGAKLVARSAVSPTQILFNTATNSGGGIDMHGPASMTFTGSVNGNTATLGGGIAARTGANSNDDVHVILDAANASSPVSVSDNTASLHGGGIYLQPGVQVNGIAHASLLACEFRINGNSAADGAAIYGGTDSTLGITFGSDVEINNGCTEEIPRCSTGVACNEISGNESVTTTGTPTDGSVISMQNTSVLNAVRTKFQNNRGASIVRSVGDTDTQVTSVLMSDNTVTNELIHADQGGFADFEGMLIANSTFAHNSIGAQHVIRAAGSITVRDSIFNEAVFSTIDFAGNTNTATRRFNFILTNPNDNTFALGAKIFFGTPKFFDVAHGDYHLAAGSLGIDTSSDAAPSVDLDNNPRVVDLPTIPNLFGALDLGAYELQRLPPPCNVNDGIFCDGFEIE